MIVSTKRENSIFFCLQSTLCTGPYTFKTFSHPNEYKFKHGFCDTINLTCDCGAEVETSVHFLLLYHSYSTQRYEPFDEPEKADWNFFSSNVFFMEVKNKQS